MTDEIRQRANQLYDQIEHTRVMECIIDKMIHSITRVCSMECIIDKMMSRADYTVTIECTNVGTVKMKVDDIFSALSYIRDVLREKKEGLEDEYRML